MPATWESANSDPTTATTDTSMVVTAPTGIAVGDLLVAFGGCVSARTISAPAGWTDQTAGGSSDGTFRIYVWTKVADASDAAAGTFTFTASATFNNGNVAVHRVSGASTNAPTIQAQATAGGTQTHACPNLTTPSNDCLVFWGGYGSASNTSTANKGTERVDNANATSGCWMANYTNLEATAGVITGATLTTSGFAAKRTFSVAFESAGGGGGAVVSSSTLMLLGVGV
jgi:hypothetical protein